MGSQRVLLSGNEAVAQGAFEGGVRVAAGYPGTPSTEIIESLARYPGVYVEWSPNEKVALDVAMGAALGGARSLAAMKHVGLNVAADPLLTAAYVGVRAGMVIVTADDPGMFSSQNEQDNRNYARFARAPMLEPSDSQEAKDFTRRAFELSELFDTPVLVRTTTRISHCRSLVERGERVEGPVPRGFVRNPEKYVMIPGHARRRHPVVEERMGRLKEFLETCDLNRVEWRDRRLGIITGGISYQYVREACPDASILKLGVSYPLPERLAREFAAGVESLYVVEELDPFWEEQLKAMGLRVRGKEILPSVGEFDPDTVAHALLGKERAQLDFGVELPPRPPLLCAGCPHRGVFYVLGKLKAAVMGDIGCYTLGALPPLQALDTCTCMGAGLGQALGLDKALGAEASGATVAVIGDSTFFHSGITGLLDIVYNRGAVTVIILDNGTTAMTGHQPHPGTGLTARGEPGKAVDLERLVRSLGVERVHVVDPYDLEALERVVESCRAAREPSVVIARRACVLLAKEPRAPRRVSPDLCTGCGVCRRLGCPALTWQEEKAEINEAVCTGCAVCVPVCRQGAIGGEDRDEGAR